MCVSVCIRSRECRYPKSTKESAGSSGAGVADGCELLGIWVLGAELSPLKEQQMFLTADPALQLPRLFFINEWHFCVQAGSRLGQWVRLWQHGSVSPFSLGSSASSGSCRELSYRSWRDVHLVSSGCF